MLKGGYIYSDMNSKKDGRYNDHIDQCLVLAIVIDLYTAISRCINSSSLTLVESLKNFATSIQLRRRERSLKLPSATCGPTRVSSEPW